LRSFFKEIGLHKAVRFRKVKPFIMLFCIVFALVYTVGSTLAWFTTKDSRTNNMQTPPEKGFNVKEVDVFDNTPHNGIYNKRVGSVNMKEKPAFVRLLIMATIELPGDPPTALPASIGGPGSGAMVIMTDMNTADWIDGGDGYYYYKHILQGGESTDTGWDTGTDHNLFNHVSLAIQTDNDEDVHVKIEVVCQAVGITPSTEYIDAWWQGITPTSEPLYSVYTALQSVLGLQP